MKEKELLQIEIFEGVSYVDATSVYNIINTTKDFASWIARKIQDNRLIEGKDYIVFIDAKTMRRNKKHYKLSIGTAIKLLSFSRMQEQDKVRIIKHLKSLDKHININTDDKVNVKNGISVDVSDVQTMNNDLFGKIRFVYVNDRVYAVANDVLKALGYKKGSWRTILARNCKDVTQSNTFAYNGTPYNLIAEGDIYRLIMNSTLPAANDFERWVYDEVLPSIRKHGLYATNTAIDNMLNDPDTAIKLLKQYKEEREERIKLLKINKDNQPKLEAYNEFINSDGLYSIATAARMIRVPLSNKTLLGRNTLLAWLRRDGVLINKGKQKNLPYQVYMNKGYFKLKHKVTNNDIDSVKDSSYKYVDAYVTPQGLEWIKSTYNN